jgi:glycosyltransferase involved in cell wall biosynthesis
MKNMKINFIFPFPPISPGGGTKVMYEYANRLAGKDHDVVCYHSIKTSYLNTRKPYLLRLFYFYVLRTRVPKWFRLSTKVKSVSIPYIDDKYVRDADIIISTWWSTAIEVNGLAFSKGKKFNLVQDYEIWTGHIDKVHASYKLPARKIVYVKYLLSNFEKLGVEQAIYIPIGIDSSKFFLYNKIENRAPHSIAMMYSEEPRKNSAFGIECMIKMKELYPDIQVNFFSVSPKPSNLPTWINYYLKPKNLNDIYNSSAIYFTPALQEGWALPPAEAMTAGCALICSNIPGHQDYAFENETALKFNPGDLNSTINSLQSLFDDNNLRIRLAYNGNRFCKRYDWDVATSSIEKLFSKDTSLQ